MKIEEAIKALLREKGMAVVPKLGTFRIGHVEASVEEQGGVISPPADIVKFSTDTSALEKASVETYLKNAGYPAEFTQQAIAQLVDSVKAHTDADAKSSLQGIGFFRKDEEGKLEFFSEEQVTLPSESFGLPKLTARPLVPVVMPPRTPSKPASNSLLLKAILVPLAIIALVLVFFVFNQDAAQSFTGLFSGSETPEREIEKSPDNSDLGEIRPVEEGEIEELDKKEPEEVEEKVVVAPKKDTGATDGGVVTGKTDRFYIIIGSFQSDAAAQKAIVKANKIGYPGAKIVKINNKTRVSVDDYAGRSNAVAKAKRVGKEFPGAWVLAN